MVQLLEDDDDKKKKRREEKRREENNKNKGRATKRYGNQTVEDAGIL